jgi:hypothetical protein
LPRIRKWIEECSKDHPNCAYVEKLVALPKRVLKVQSNYVKDSVMLVETGEMLGTYMTLSHCWGQAQLVTTVKGNLELRKGGIEWKSLPPTFQDAVALTQALGIEYLWIDSLCIVQDDRSDWEVESKKMGDIYFNSFLNLAATHSPNSQGGLFSSRWLDVALDIDDSALEPRKKMRIPIEPWEILAGANDTTQIYVRPELESGHEDLYSIGYLSLVSAPLVSLAGDPSISIN